MVIVVKEEKDQYNEYTALKDDNGNPIKFKNVGDAEGKLRSVFKAGSGTTSFMLIL